MIDTKDFRSRMIVEMRAKNANYFLREYTVSQIKKGYIIEINHSDW